MYTVTELLEVLSSRGITQCEECSIWGEGMNIDEADGLMKCAACEGGEA